MHSYVTWVAVKLNKRKGPPAFRYNHTQMPAKETQVNAAHLVSQRGRERWVEPSEGESEWDSENKMPYWHQLRIFSHTLYSNGPPNFSIKRWIWCAEDDVDEWKRRWDETWKRTTFFILSFHIRQHSTKESTAKFCCFSALVLYFCCCCCCCWAWHGTAAKYTFYNKCLLLLAEAFTNHFEKPYTQ